MKIKLLPSEKDIQTAILQYLRFKGFFAMRMNSGSILTQKGHRVALNEPGTPDIMCFKQLRDGMGVDLIFIEVKRPGNKPTFLQQQKMAQLAEYGAMCYVATSVEQLQDAGL